MYIVSIVLFVLGMFLCGFAFSIEEPWSAVVFVGGILAVSAALALPIHSSRRAMTEGSPPRS